VLTRHRVLYRIISSLHLRGPTSGGHHKAGNSNHRSSPHLLDSCSRFSPLRNHRRESVDRHPRLRPTRRRHGQPIRSRSSLGIGIARDCREILLRQALSRSSESSQSRCDFVPCLFISSNAAAESKPFPAALWVTGNLFFRNACFSWPAFPLRRFRYLPFEHVNLWKTAGRLACWECPSALSLR